MNSNPLILVSNRRQVALFPEEILYIRLEGRKTTVHVAGGRVYETYTAIDELARSLGSSFIRADRSSLVAARAIYAIGKKIELINGELLDYTSRRKREIREQLLIGRQQIRREFSQSSAPETPEDYCLHYASFDSLPFAFTDIEMVFTEEQFAIDWIFRYGNPALAALERLPLEKLINHSFGSIFPNMDAKWLRVYERTALYGETLEIEDYSPEIDTDLKIICFPTFKGHCGCLLFDRRSLQPVQAILPREE